MTAPQSMVVQALTGKAIADRLTEALPGRGDRSAVDRFEGDGVWVRPDRIVEVASFLRDDPDLDFQYLNSVTAVDFIEYFEVVYHLTSLRRRHTAVVKAQLFDRISPGLPSVYDVWRGADLQEREVWDLMGIHFEGHPNMKRILLWEGFEGYPLRKDFL